MGNGSPLDGLKDDLEDLADDLQEDLDALKKEYFISLPIAEEILACEPVAFPQPGQLSDYDIVVTKLTDAHASLSCPSLTDASDTPLDPRVQLRNLSRAELNYAASTLRAEYDEDEYQARFDVIISEISRWLDAKRDVDLYWGLITDRIQNIKSYTY